MERAHCAQLTFLGMLLTDFAVPGAASILRGSLAAFCLPQPFLAQPAQNRHSDSAFPVAERLHATVSFCRLACRVGACSSCRVGAMPRLGDRGGDPCCCNRRRSGQRLHRRCDSDLACNALSIVDMQYLCVASMAGPDVDVT